MPKASHLAKAHCHVTALCWHVQLILSTHARIVEGSNCNDRTWYSSLTYLQLFNQLDPLPQILFDELARPIALVTEPMTWGARPFARVRLHATPWSYSEFLTSSSHLTVPSNSRTIVWLSVCVREHAILHLFVTLRPVIPSIAPRLSFVEQFHPIQKIALRPRLCGIHRINIGTDTRRCPNNTRS